MDKPNIIYIQSDQHNPAVTGCYGDPVVETPNLDKLARNGTVITGAYCASPICVPSRMSAITGRYPHENKVWTNDQILDSAIPTYAHSLGANGYNPVQIGRMHFNGIDQYHGFSERLVGDHSRNYNGSPRPPGTHGDLNGTAGPSRFSLENSGTGQTAYEIHDEVVAETAVEYINDLGKTPAKERKPISLSIGLMLPHQPFIARKKDYEKYEGKVGLPKVPAEALEDCHPYIKWWRERTGIEQVTDEEIMRCRIAYWALVDRMDNLIGQILNALEVNGFMENTMVVYTSDHGEQVGEHGLWWKQTFYENASRVPAIISWPGHILGGQVLDNVINQFDLIATMLDASGSPKLPRSNGRSLLKLLKDPRNTDWENLAFSEYCMDDADYFSTSSNLGGLDIHAMSGGVQNRMIRYNEYKLNYYNGFEPQLFNLKEDPDELNDLAKDKSHENIRKDLTNKVLENWDPNEIAEKMRVLRRETEIKKDWGTKIDPDDSLRWDLDPLKDSTRLDN